MLTRGIIHHTIHCPPTEHHTLLRFLDELAREQQASALKGSEVQGLREKLREEQQRMEEQHQELQQLRAAVRLRPPVRLSKRGIRRGVGTLMLVRCGSVLGRGGPVHAVWSPGHLNLTAATAAN